MGSRAVFTPQVLKSEIDLHDINDAQVPVSFHAGPERIRHGFF
jgi:hypothetical protein